eukprot:10530527-Heterocapsa_arctica.AAC.1
MDAGATRQVRKWDPRPMEVGDYSGPAPFAGGSAERDASAKARAATQCGGCFGALRHLGCAARQLLN